MTDYDAGRRAATAYHTRYGQEAVLLRASAMRRAHGKAEYARGFWQRTNEIAGLGEDLTWPTSEAERLRSLRPDQPCGHPGCLHHVSHPCEGCGRIAGRWPEELAPADEEVA